LRLFLKTYLIADPNDDLNVNEILEGYFRDCIGRGISAIPLDAAGRILPGLISELFGVMRVNDIKRMGKNQRGFSKVRFV
jgi:hypothetical protein